MIPPEPPAFWYTDLISWVPNTFTSSIDLGISIDPLILIGSPFINVPEVWTNIWDVFPPPWLTAYPKAPLLIPSTYEVAGNSVLESAKLVVIWVYVCTSNKYRSHELASLL